MLGSLTALAGLELRSMFRRNIRAASLCLAALIFAVGAAFYGLSALGILLAARYGLFYADLMIGGGLLACAVLAMLVAWFVRHRARSDQAKMSLALAAAPMALAMGRKLAPNMLKAAPLMLIAGLVFGRYVISKD